MLQYLRIKILGIVFISDWRRFIRNSVRRLNIKLVGKNKRKRKRRRRRRICRTRTK